MDFDASVLLALMGIVAFIAVCWVVSYNNPHSLQGKIRLKPIQNQFSGSFFHRNSNFAHWKVFSLRQCVYCSYVRAGRDFFIQPGEKY